MGPRAGHMYVQGGPSDQTVLVVLTLTGEFPWLAGPGRPSSVVYNIPKLCRYQLPEQMDPPVEHLLQFSEFVKSPTYLKHSDSSTSSVVTSPDLETTEDPVAVAESLPHSLAAAVDEEEADEAELSRQHSRQVGK